MMNSDIEKKKGKPWLLPLIAGIMLLAALVVVFFVPNRDRQTGEDAADVNEEGNLVIHADSLSSNQISFIRPSRDSRIELLARAGDDGMVKASLGACQSCNGSPKAYYTQEGNELKCNNCGLTFPLSVIDSPKGGCHPIMIDESILHYEGNDLVIDLKGLSQYEKYFENVVDH